MGRGGGRGAGKAEQVPDWSHRVLITPQPQHTDSLCTQQSNMPIVTKPALDTLPTDSRWKYVEPDDIVRCRVLWVDPEAPDTDLHKSTGM